MSSYGKVMYRKSSNKRPGRLFKSMSSRVIHPLYNYNKKGGAYSRGALIQEEALIRGFTVYEMYGRSCKDIINSGSNGNFTHSFYSQIFLLAKELLHPVQSSQLIIENEHLFDNANLKIGSQTICFPSLKGLKMKDILNDTGNLLHHQEVAQKCGLDNLAVNSLIACIPKNWKKRLKSKTVLCTDETSYFYFDNLKKKCENTTCKDVYWFYINKFSSMPSCISKWH